MGATASTMDSLLEHHDVLRLVDTLGTEVEARDEDIAEPSSTVGRMNRRMPPKKEVQNRCQTCSSRWK